MVVLKPILGRMAVAAGAAMLAVATAPACSGPKCGSGDLQCLLDNIVIVPPEDGAAPQRLTHVAESKIPTRSGATATATSADAGTPCPPGDAYCPGTGCTYTGGDPKNCGGCGKACDSRQICDNGLCQCPGSNPSCLAGAPPAEAPPGSPPSITGKPTSFDFSEPQTLQPMNLSFVDPNGCQPAFCARLCKGKTCTGASSCAPPVKDGLTSGVWRSYLGFLAEPPERADFTLGMTPISAPGCPADLLDRMNEGTLVPDVGPEITIEVSVAGDPSSTSSTSGGSGTSTGTSSGGPGTQCSPQASTCNCSLRACSDGSNCWYETSHGRFTCSGCSSCTAAAQSAISSCCPKP